jgi:hypothetical protein
MAAVTAVYPAYCSNTNGIMVSGPQEQMIHFHTKINLAVEMYEKYSLNTFSGLQHVAVTQC